MDRWVLITNIAIFILYVRVRSRDVDIIHTTHINMLYIFRVDIGTMINLDMNYALETVAHLKAAVASYCNIPIEKQVSGLV